MMKLNKITKVVVPIEKNPWRGGLYDVYFEDVPDQKVVMTKAHYDLVVFEEKLCLNNLCPIVQILEHRELAIKYCEDERSREGESF